MTALSAVVPTRDRPHLVRDCVSTLLGQTAPPGALEVIVVDDGSSSDPAEHLPEGSATVPVRLVRQEPAGLNAARNHGAALARGDVVAYLDDDTLVSAGWAASVLDAFERLAPQGLAGRIELRLEGSEPPWLSRKLRSYLSELDLGSQPRWLEHAFPYGANCALDRTVLERTGGFRAGLDRDGASLLSNGDIELFARVRAQGGRMLYWPGAHVLHRVPAERLTIEWFRRRAFAQGASDVRLEAMLAESRTHRTPRERVRAARSLPILIRGLLHGRGTVNARLWLAYCRGRRVGLAEGVAG